MQSQHGQQNQELADEVILLRQEVVVLRESIDEFRDDLVHVLRLIADQYGALVVESNGRSQRIGELFPRSEAELF